MLCRRIARIARDEYEAYPTDAGMVYLNLSESQMMVARALGLYEPEKHALMRRILKPGMTFIDAGANKGDFSLAAACLVGEQGRVVAIEPEPRNCEWIRRSVSINHYKNITVSELALSNVDGRALLHLGRKSGWHSLKAGLADRQEGRIAVRTARLDSLLLSLGLNRIDVLKIDVEGGELELLLGAEETLSQSRNLMLLIDLHPHLGVDVAALETFLSGKGFRFFESGAPHRELERLPSEPSDIVAVRDLELLTSGRPQFAQNRLSTWSH